MNKVAGYKINIQKSIAFLYINDKTTEVELKKGIPFTIATKCIRYLWISLIKEVKNLYRENYENL